MRAFFLGPKSENESWVRSEIQSILEEWFQYRQSLFPGDPEVISAKERRSIPFLQRREELSSHLSDLLNRLKGETPKFTPRYIGHMVSETSLPAIFGHFAALLHNPNNTSREVSRVTSELEEEAIAMLASMIGYDPNQAQGHFTSGGTIANFEAIWRARFRMDHWVSLALYLAEECGAHFDLIQASHMGWQRYYQLVKEHDVDEKVTRQYSIVGSNPFRTAARLNKYLDKPYEGPVVLVPGNKHFSWVKGTSVFGLGEDAFWTVPLNANGRVDRSALTEMISRAHSQNRPVMMVVTVAGTTETGEIDRVDRTDEILRDMQNNDGLDIWHHVDAAYGGFLCTMLGGEDENLFAPDCLKALKAIRRANSVTLDPHKLGYVPYSCGAFLTLDAENYRMPEYRAPYLERAHVGPEKWAMTLEGSRSAAGVTATWLSGRALGFNPNGMGRIIAATMHAARDAASYLYAQCNGFQILQPLDSNILCFSIAYEGEPLSSVNQRVEAIFDSFLESESFSISKTTLIPENYGALMQAHMDQTGGAIDCDHMVLLRCVFMNPFWAKEAVSNQLLPELAIELQRYSDVFDGL